MEQNKGSSKITVEDEEGNALELYVIEETKFNGMFYLLATDTDSDEDGECYILKDMSKDSDSDAIYEFVEDEDELDYMFQIFSELVDDSDVELSR